MSINPARTTARGWRLSLSLLLTLGLGACDSAPTEPEGIRLQHISFAQWQQQLPRYRPTIVVVDAWAMWCSPCIERFPKMVEMDEKYRDAPVTFVSLNLDDHNDQQALANAQTFLQEQNAQFDHFHITDNLIDAFDQLDLKGIPAVLIYDGEGKERFRLTGNNPNRQFTDDDIDQAVQQLLAEREE